MFCVIVSEESFRREVPQDITKCENSHFNYFIEEKCIKESIIPKKAVPFNFPLKKKRMNEFMVQLLKAKN